MIRLNTCAAAALLALAVGCAHRAAGPGARTDSSSAMKDTPISANTHFAAGQLAESEGRLPQAVEQYKQALALNPRQADAMFRLGVAYAELRDFPNAIQTWNRYIDLTGGSATAFSNLGFCQELAGNPPAAEAAYQKGILRDPRSEPCHVNYGLMLARNGRPVEGLHQLQIVLPPAQRTTT